MLLPWARFDNVYASSTSPASQAMLSQLLWLATALCLAVQCSSSPFYRSCRQVLRHQPSCCLSDDSTETRNTCAAKRFSKATGKQDGVCLCHRACERLGNCCRGFQHMCPTPGRSMESLKNENDELDFEGSKFKDLISVQNSNSNSTKVTV